MANQYKVVIVGAGVAGLYAAWRMAVDPDGQAITGLQPSDVLVVEGGSKTGGRLFTMPMYEFLPNDPDVPTTPTVRAELGGMRFLNFHTWVGSLAQHLGLTYVSFPADSATNWHYLRGSVMQSFSNQASTPTFASEKVYALTPAEQQAMQPPAGSTSYPTPGSLVADALEQIVNPDGNLPDPGQGASLRDMVNQLLATDFPGTDTPLWQRGLWNVMVSNGDPLTDPVSNEAYEFWIDAGAYDSVPSNWNAATAAAMVLSDFSNTSTYFALTDGYESLCDALLEQLADAGVTVQLNATVTGVSSQDGGYAVSFVAQDAVTADNVFMAVPPRAMQLLAQDPASPLPSTSAIARATPEPMVKIFLVYKNAGQTPWWAAFLPGGTGDLPQYTRLTTDLPLRQTYNFGTALDASGENTYSLVQVSYTDALRAGYWAGLLSAEGTPTLAGEPVNASPFADLAPLTGVETATTGYVEWTDGSPLSGHPLFSTAHAQFVNLLTQIYGATSSGEAPDVVEPVAGATMDWGTDPFGGGYNTWNVGVNVETVYWDILNPVPMQGAGSGTTGTGGLFVVGEGYSVLQGWVEGALWTVEDALGQAFGGAWANPSWWSGSPVPPPAS